jgi:hypothetical protein
LNNWYIIKISKLKLTTGFPNDFRLVEIALNLNFPEIVFPSFVISLHRYCFLHLNSKLHFSLRHYRTMYLEHNCYLEKITTSVTARAFTASPNKKSNSRTNTEVKKLQIGCVTRTLRKQWFLNMQQDQRLNGSII